MATRSPRMNSQVVPFPGTTSDVLIPVALELLYNDNEVVRLGGVEILRQLNAAEELVSHFGQPRTLVYLAIRKALVSIGSAAIPALLAGLNTSSRRVRQRCLRCLEDIVAHDGDVLDLLEAHDRHEDPEVRQHLLALLIALDVDASLTRPRLPEHSITHLSSLSSVIRRRLRLVRPNHRKAS